MASTWKVMGQAKPAAASDVDLFTVGVGKSLTLKTVTVCNLAGLTSYRIAVRPDGAALADQHYVVYEAQVGGQTTDVLAFDIGMDAGDVMTVRSASGSVAFGAFGLEVS